MVRWGTGSRWQAAVELWLSHLDKNDCSEKQAILAGRWQSEGFALRPVAKITFTIRQTVGAGRIPARPQERKAWQEKKRCACFPNRSYKTKVFVYNLFVQFLFIQMNGGVGTIGLL